MLDNKEFEDKAWGEMLNILDNEMPVRKPILWWRYGVLLLLLIPLLGGGYYLLNSNSELILDNEVVEIPTQQFASVRTTELNNAEKKIIANKPNLIDPTLDANSATSQQKTNNLKSTQNKSTNVTNEVIATSTTSKYVDNKPSVVNNDFTSESIEVVTTINTSNEHINNDHSIIEKNTSTNKEEEILIVGASEVLSSKNTDDLSFQQKFSESLLGNSVASLDHLNLDDDFQARSLIDENITVNKIFPKRRVNVSAFGKLNYYTENIGALETGILANVGHQRSPWSFSTGISYEKLYFADIGVTLDKNSDLTTGVGDTTDLNEVVNDPFSGVSRDFSNQLDASYLNIPLMFHYRLNRFNIGLGITNSFLLNSTSNAESFAANVTDTDSNFNKYRVAFTQSIDFRISPSLYMGIDANFDLSGLKPETSIVNGPVKLNRFGLKVGYQF